MYIDNFPPFSHHIHGPDNQPMNISISLAGGFLQFWPPMWANWASMFHMHKGNGLEASLAIIYKGAAILNWIHNYILHIKN